MFPPSRSRRPLAIIPWVKHQVMRQQRTRRFPPPWTFEQIPGGYKVLDANGQSLAYVYGRETKADADIANVLTMDEARRIAAKSPSHQHYLARVQA